MIEILVYETETGKSPFYKWLDKLDINDVAIIETRLDRLSIGNFGNCEPVGEGVFELKIDHGPGYRIYFGKIGKVIVLLLNAGDKRNQSRDIDKAKEYWLDYKENLDGKNIKLPKRTNKKTKRS